MEKFTILCGMKGYIEGYKFMRDVAESLERLGCRVCSVISDTLVLNTEHTRTAFIYDISKQPLNGIEADVIFGKEPYKQQLIKYLKAMRPYDVGMGLVDYILEVEKNAKMTDAKHACDAACKKFNDLLKDKIERALNIPADAFTMKADVASSENAYNLKDKMYITTGRGSGKTELMRKLKEALKEQGHAVYESSTMEWPKVNPYICYGPAMPEIKNVIFNNPATIVFWADGTKTVVQCQGDDIYDPEKGLAMAMCKKMLGNKREYYHTFKHWMKKSKES